jgi:hypothetical protein
VAAVTYWQKAVQAEKCTETLAECESVLSSILAEGRALLSRVAAGPVQFDPFDVSPRLTALLAAEPNRC